MSRSPTEPMPDTWFPVEGQLVDARKYAAFWQACHDWNESVAKQRQMKAAKKAKPKRWRREGVML